MALDGVKVLALEQAVAMPFATWILAEMGADVIKIERTGSGDVIRGWDDRVHGLSTGFVWVNAGKRDLAIDLGTAEGREIARTVALKADVFVENLTPGAAGRLGLGCDDLRTVNPKLVYCSLSGYGQTGPYRDRKAYDLLIQGESGLLATTGLPEHPAKIGLPIADLVAGTYAVIGILLALRARDRNGVGSYIDLAMFDSIVSWLGYYPQHYWHGGGEPQRTGMRHQYLAPYGPYKAADGVYVNVVVASDRDWRTFCDEVVCKPEWFDDERFATIASRSSNRAIVDTAVEEAFSQLPSPIWLERLTAARLPFGLVRGIAQVLEHPQLAARDLVCKADSSVGSLPMIRFPLADPDRPRRLPSLGQDTEAVLAQAGYSPELVRRLHSSGIVESPAFDRMASSSQPHRAGSDLG
jgi:itaconate CoA-transferase